MKTDFDYGTYYLLRDDDDKRDTVNVQRRDGSVWVDVTDVENALGCDIYLTPDEVVRLAANLIKAAGEVSAVAKDRF